MPGDGPRKFARIPLSCRIRISVPGMERFFIEYSRNLSEGGMFIQTSNPRPVGTCVYLEFSLKNGDELVRVKAEVVWTRSLEESNDSNPPGMGLKFLDMDERTKGIIQRALDYHAAKGNS